MGEELSPPRPPPPSYATEWNTFFPKSGGVLRSDAHQSQIIGRDEDVDHTQIIGGDTVKSLEKIYPPSSGFGTLVNN